MSSILQRIEQIAKKEGITITALERKIGASKGVLSRALNNNTDIQVKWIQAMVENYPLYDSEWLLTGKGEMIKGVNPIVSVRKEIEDNECLRNVPIIDIEAAAGIGQYNSDYIETLGHIKIPTNSLQSRTATYYAIRTRGDSMFPTIIDKDLLIARVLDRGEWEYLRDEYVYIISDREGKTYVKRIRDRLKRGFIVLTSDNLDKTNYPNFTLEENELHQFLYPEFRMTAHFPNINASYFNRLKDVEDRIDELSQQFKRIENKQ
ncbi:MAG TPA: transcriptional regulator [Porphyromonadaceae bacterium]|nr:transcriptional regulator [Porphyromonadaceae bacterium]